MKKVMLSAGLAALLAVSAFPAMADEAATADEMAPATTDTDSVDASMTTSDDSATTAE